MNFTESLQVIQTPDTKSSVAEKLLPFHLQKRNQGILASNNLRDISAYVTEYGLSHLTTGDIMKMAFDAGYINEAQGNTIWANMLARKRKLGYRSFSDYLAKHQSEKS